MEAHLEPKTLEQLAVNTIRTLPMAAVQAANSGHPGTPMALARRPCGAPLITTRELSVIVSWKCLPLR